MGLFGKGGKPKVVGVDPVDFLALRAELADVKSRLEASEQERAIIEAHLSSLDASATAFASTRTNIERLSSKVDQLEGQVQAPVVAAAAPNPASEALTAKVDALHQRMMSAPDLSPRIAELEAALAEVTNKVQAPPMAPPPDPSTLPPAPPTVDVSPRIAELEAMLREVAAKVEAVEAAPPAAPVAAPVGAAPADTGTSLLGDLPSPTELELIGRLDELQQRVASIDSLHSQIETLTTRLEQQQAAAAPFAAEVAPTDAAASAAAQTALAEQAAQLAQLAERVAATDAAARLATEQVGGIDQRLSNISQELANQISELGRDIDSLADQPATAGSAVSDETIEALRASQVKLAAEQARYEIAFREDLAALAEQIRRGNR
jgi:chromosome segregation ATPase